MPAPREQHTRETNSCRTHVLCDAEVNEPRRVDRAVLALEERAAQEGRPDEGALATLAQDGWGRQGRDRWAELGGHGGL